MSLVAQRVSRRIGNRPPLLEAVDLTLEPGQCHALLGANGAGKSQLIGLLAGDRAPDEGRVTLDGRPLAQWSPPALAQRRAVFGQADALRFAFTARELVALGRLPHGRGDPHAMAAVDEALHWVEMTEQAERSYLSLSGGERARLRLARALAQVLERPPTSPGYLLLDEPLAHFDAGFRLRALHRLRQLAGQGYGILLALHEPELAIDWADRITLLSAGRLVCNGPAQALDAAQLSRAYGAALRVTSGARLRLAEPFAE